VRTANALLSTDARRALATLGMHSQRLSRQFQKNLGPIKRAAAVLELHKHKGIPFNPAEAFYSEDGFVFSKHQVEAFAHRLLLLNQSRHLEHVLFHMPAPIPSYHESTSQIHKREGT
jgi:hypothetical protein